MNKIKIINLQSIILVFSVFATTQIFFVLVATMAGYPSFDFSIWSRWDSGHYLDISKSNIGYELFPCAGKFGYPEESKLWCGNTAWFPGYPLLIKSIHYLFPISHIFIATLISKIFFLASLGIIASLTKLKSFSFSNFIFLLLASFFWSSIYLNTVFPNGMLVFLNLLGICLFLKQRFFLTTICCFLAALTYPSGSLLSGVFTISMLLPNIFPKYFTNNNRCLKKNVTYSLTLLLSGLFGLIVYFVYLNFSVGDWQGFFLVQEKYRNNSNHFFIWNIYKTFLRVTIDFTSANNYFIAQTIAIIFMIYKITSVYLKKKWFQNNFLTLFYLYLMLYFLFPWTVGGNLSVYRSESLLLPGVILLKDFHFKFQIKLLSVMIIISGFMSYMFFTAKLV